MGGTEFQRISRVRQTVLTRLMESEIWYLPAGYVVRGFRKGTVASARLSVWEKAVPCSPLHTRHFSYFLYATGAFQDASLVLELRGSESE